MNKREDIGCQIGSGPIINDDGDIAECGDPVVAKWMCDDGVSFYVCQKHDDEAMKNDELNENESEAK